MRSSGVASAVSSARALPMPTTADKAAFLRAVVLGDDDGGAGGKAYKKADKQIDDGGVGAADRAERRLADKAAEYDRVNGRI